MSTTTCLPSVGHRCCPRLGQSILLYPMKHGKIMAKSYLAKSLSNASSSVQKQQRPFPQLHFSLEEGPFFGEVPPRQEHGSREAQHTASTAPEFGVSSDQPDQSGEGAEDLCPAQPSQHPNNKQSRYVYRTSPGKSSHRGANSSLLFKFARRNKRPMGPRIYLGPQIRVCTGAYQLMVPVMHLRPQQMEIIDSEVIALDKKGAIIRVLSHSYPFENQFVSPLFTVPKKGRGFRPVINLKGLNHFQEYQHFKMQGVTMLKDLLRRGDLLTKIDLKDAYLTIPISKQDQKYLRFRWKNQLWQFLSLPFGLAKAPRVFTKILKPVVAHLRKRDIRLIIYLDDILIMSASKELALEHSNTAASLLSNLGFVINREKSILSPTWELEFLGFLVNSKTMSMSLPRDKIRGIKRECQNMLENPRVSVRDLSCLFLGKLSASIQAVFPAPLHYQFLQKAKHFALKKSLDYETMLTLDHAAQEELTW
ncbi:uncharacterized protein LOC116601217 [Nematostella vectensis]|uniref:uncharacterized protein LOC116601217 n=1 Tax=Nematostella vectensis TaxID=45351 RepID=UPI0020773054|nr:uncharacterized protein LOC116601217 [Nematostella vectensis]